MKLQFLQRGDTWGGMPFFFNLTRPVGKGYSSSPVDDVSFVQFAFAAIANSSATAVPPNLLDSWRKVQVTGVMDAATQAAIDAWLLDRRTRFGRSVEVDGILSVCPPYTNYAKNTPYAVAAINYVLLYATPSIWPRLDMHRLATAPLKDAVRSALSSALTG